MSIFPLSLLSIWNFLLVLELLTSSQIIFLSMSVTEEKDTKLCTQVLDNMILESSLSLSIAIIASDASVKNNIANSMSYIHTFDKSLIKTIYYTVYITSTEVELFVIRCGINQSLSLDNISKIIVITDTFHAVKKIFNPSVYPYQL